MATAAVRIRPYSDFLTALMHRRFSRSAAILLLVCYVEAVVLGQWNSLFWSWFPLGRVGIRTALIFISGFIVFLLRLSQMHVGVRTTSSGYHTFCQYAFNKQTLYTAVHYLISAWLFSEIYIFTAHKNANIRWVTDARNNERPRLNERPIYLTSYFMMLALLQTAVHLYHDYDRVPTPGRKPNPTASTAANAARKTMNPYDQIRGRLLPTAKDSVQKALAMTIIGPVIYSLVIRQSAWSWTLMFAKIFWNLPKSTAIPMTTPFHWRILLRCLSGGFMLIMLWEIANLALSTYLAQEPLKLERPITYESRDPNGSLITGLKGKKMLARVFATWELLKISQEYQGRRKTLYEEIDRSGGTTWNQVSTICLDVVNEINKRISEHTNPPPPAKQPENKIESSGLPRLTGGLQREEGGIFSAAPPPRDFASTFAQSTAATAKTYGQTPSSPVAKAEQLLIKAKSAVLTKEQEETLTPAGISALVRPYALQFLQSPLGEPFRQQYRRSLNAIVLGVPYGDVGRIVDSIDILTSLSLHSLKEDPYGNVQHSIGNIIRTFTVTITSIENLKTNLPFHWTDIDKRRESPEAEEILKTLRSGLQDLVDAFTEFSKELKLSFTDMHKARAALQVPEKEEQPIRKKVEDNKEKEREKAKEDIKGKSREMSEMKQKEQRPTIRQRKSTGR